MIEDMIAVTVDDSTATRLLEVATRLFAERGYEGVSVRELAEAAEANVAAVSYHFGSKERLYRAALLAAHQAVADPMIAALASQEPAEVRLRTYVGLVIDHVINQERGGVCMISREIAAPTPALDELIERNIRPLFERLRATCCELLPAGASAQVADLAASSVVGQCFHWHHCRQVMDRLHPGCCRDAQVIANHIADLTIAGLRNYPV